MSDHLHHAPADNDGVVGAGIDRRSFLRTAGVGAAGLAMASTSLLAPDRADAAEMLLQPRQTRHLLTPGVTPRNASFIARLPTYRGPWNKIHRRPFGGFNFALGYVAEGVDTGDPLQQGRNPSGLFESSNPAIPSGVGGNETQRRSAEFWYREILGWDNETLAHDIWSAINYLRRMFAIDIDDPDADGTLLPDGTRYEYPGSPDPDDDITLFSSRVAIDGRGGIVRMAPTLLAPSVGYTVVFRAGHSHPNYSGGTTAMSPDDVGKVRDGGVWGGTLESMDVLAIMQEVASGERRFTTPDGPRRRVAQWGQWWRRVAPIDGVDIDAIDPATPVAARPAPRPQWPVGYLERGTDYFWGNYDLKMGRREDTILLHYESQVPTRFRDFDGIPEAFICELIAHPGGTDMPQSQIDQGFKDTDGSMSGFADFSDPELNGQNQFGLGRVHGTSYPRGVDEQGRATFHLRNWLLFPPRLNAVNTINDTVPGKGMLDFG